MLVSGTYLGFDPDRERLIDGFLRLFGFTDPDRLRDREPAEEWLGLPFLP